MIAPAGSGRGRPAVALRALRSAAARLLPSRRDYAGLRSSWARDLVAGATVGVVALPLALGFGIATGVGPGPGLVTAIVAGAVAAVFGGSDVQVSGPTGAMAVVLVPLVQRHGPDVIYPLALLAGVLIAAAGALRAGRLLAFVPWPLVEGFTVGIAVVIAAQQVPTVLGATPPDLDNAVAAAAVSVGRWIAHPALAPVIVAGVTAAAMLGLGRLHRAIPAGLIAVALASVVASAADLDVARIGALPAGLPVPALPDLHGASALLPAALVVAFLGALESGLSARVADGMSDGRRHSTDRELFGQGLANIASGVAGGMPATGAIARTAVNVRAGARTRVAALTHAAVLLIVVYAASGAVSRIPLAALGAVLIITAWRMAERHNIAAVLRSTRSDAAVFLVTAACTIALDLVRAVVIGIVLAAALTLAQLSRSAGAIAEALPDPEIDDDQELRLLRDHILVYRLEGPLHFGVTTRFLDELLAVSDVDVVILRASALGMLDASGARAVGEIVEELSKRDITVLVKGLAPDHAGLLAAVGSLNRLEQRGHVLADLPEALAHARRHVRRGGGAGHGITGSIR